MKKKLMALLLCGVMLFSVALPGTLAAGVDAEGAEPATVSEPAEPDATAPTETTEGTDVPTEPTEPTEPEAPAEGDAEPEQGAQEDKPAEEPTAQEPPVQEPQGNAVDANAAYEALIKMSSIEEMEAYIEANQLTENMFTQDQLNALQAHMAELAGETVVQKTVTFTQAGPFLPAVNVARARMRAARNAETPRVTNDGVVTSKIVVKEGDSYKLRLESYVTGATTTSTETKTTPADIVVILDQSSSMNNTFSSSWWNEITNQEAMQSAVKGFIDSVAKTYSDDADHRIALVTFGKSASTVNGLTFVNQNGKNTLNNSVNRLNANSYDTAPGTGLERAYDILHTNYSYSGKNTERQKVVILFTDGVPAPSGTDDFTIYLANDAITQAKRLKDVGDTVYSIGIFKGANPDQLYGPGSNGNVDSTWSSNDRTTADSPAGNRFLNYVSCNAPGATSVGLKREVEEGGRWSSDTYKFTITENFDLEKSGYYLTASTAEDLEKIFESIAENVQTGGASVTLGSSTVVKDVISDYFQLPEGTTPNGITVKTADCNSLNADGTPVWDNDKLSTLSATIDGKTVSVTGFDFSENWVGKNTTTGVVHPGKKLIIEIPIEPRTGFLGGNNVPTNGAASGIYTGENVVENFEVPTANVAITEPVVTTSDKTIYLGNSTEVGSLHTLPDLTGENAWKDDYVVIEKTGIPEGNVSPADCTSYAATVTYKPITDGTNSAGQANAMDGVSRTGTATVHVLKPEVTATVKDVQKYYGEEYALGDDANGEIQLTWADSHSDHTNIPNAEGNAPYTKADLTLSYECTDFNDVVPNADFDVTVKVKKDEAEITNAVITTTCDVEGQECGEQETDGKYTVHVKTCELTITKNFENGSTPATGETFLFTVNGTGKIPVNDLQVVMTDTKTKTISGLPVGSYTVTEDTNWSWRYADGKNGTATLASNADGDHDTVTITNKREKEQWLDGNTWAKNLFGFNKEPVKP